MLRSFLTISIFLIAIRVDAQVSITATQGTGYYLVSESGDTLHLRGETIYYDTYRIALQDAMEYAAENLDQVYVQSNQQYRVWADFGYFDEPEYVEIIDTVYIINTVYEKIIETVDWQHRQSVPDEHILDVEVTHEADWINTYIEACGETFAIGDTIPCSQMAWIYVTGEKDFRTLTVRDSVDLNTLNEIFETNN